MSCAALGCPKQARHSCARCKSVFYCSKECQVKAWKAGHKHTCAPAGSVAGDRSIAELAEAAQSSFRLHNQLHGLCSNRDWEGIVALDAETRAALPLLESRGHPGAGALVACLALGWGKLGEMKTALGLLRQHVKRVAEKGADDDQMSPLWASEIGTCYHQLGRDALAIGFFEKSKGAYVRLGDRKNVCEMCMKLGFTYLTEDQNSKAIAELEEGKAIAEELGDREAMLRIISTLGIASLKVGRLEAAIAMQKEAKAMAEELRSELMATRACANLGACHIELGQMDEAVVLFEHVIAKLEEQVLVPRTMQTLAEAEIGLITACGDLGRCLLQRRREGDLDKAVDCFKRQHLLSQASRPGDVPGVCQASAAAAFGLGVALRLWVQDQRRAAGLPRDPQELDSRVRDAETWLQTSYKDGETTAKLHLAWLVYDAGRVEEAREHLHQFLSDVCELARLQCSGCGQERRAHRLPEHLQVHLQPASPAKDTPLLTCGGCGVTRFCSVDCQKMAERREAGKVVINGGPHKDICGLLNKWRQVAKGRAPPDSCADDVLAFLERGSAAAPRSLEAKSSQRLSGQDERSTQSH